MRDFVAPAGIDRARPIVSIQQGTIALSTAQTSNTATILAVNVDNAELILDGLTPSGSATKDGWRATLCRIDLTNSTTVTATRNTVTDDTAGAVTAGVTFTVIEYAPGVIRSVQRGTVTGSTATITAVNPTVSSLDLLGQETTSNAAASAIALVLTNSTTITRSGGSQTGGYQVIEWN
jgi:hypothetical protein